VAHRQPADVDTGDAGAVGEAAGRAGEEERHDDHETADDERRCDDAGPYAGARGGAPTDGW
jgi:hypothetical protein